MNKKMKRILVLFTLILSIIILSTLGISTLATNEDEGEEEPLRRGSVIVDSEHTHTYSDGDYIPFEHLDAYYDVYCCMKGTALPGSGNTILQGSNGDVLDHEEPYLTYNDIGKTILTSDTAFPSSYYYNRTIGRYKIEATKICTPKEAYILSEMKLVDGQGYQNYVQFAWWTTLAGSEGNTVAENAYALEADAFEAYVLEAAGVSSVDQLGHKTDKFIDDDGNIREFENAFDFEYNPEWITDGEYATPTVAFDAESKQYTVGPFALDYVESTVQFGDRPEVQFAGITGMEIYVDDSDEPLVFGEDWEFVWVEGERTADTDSEFPLSGEKFYIRIKYRDTMMKITNIKTSFKYMNACGVYQKLQGTYFEATWKQKSKTYNSGEDDEYTEYWLKLIKLEEHQAQKLALGLNAARWYKYTDLDRTMELRSGKIRIEKQVVDEDGEQVSDCDDYFTFKVTVNGALNEDSTEKIKVKAGHAANSQTYYWMGDSETPTYTVEEIDVPEGYEVREIINSSGSLDPQKTIKVVAKNIRANEGSLKIIKTIRPVVVNGVLSNLDGKTFNFNVTLTGTFTYDGHKYKNESLIIPVDVTVSGGKGEASIGTVKWYGETAPTFVVEELPNEFSELVSIIPSSGSLVNKETVTVNAINKQKVEKAKLHIIKTLENAELYDKEEIEKLAFSFVIKVDGYEQYKVVIDHPIKVNNTYIWEYTSDYFRWLYGNNPNYTITEVDNPEGTEFVSGTNDNGTWTVSGSTVSGKLTSDENTKFTVTNNIINKIDRSHTGRLQLIKMVDVNDAKLLNKVYKFKVIVNGSFDYKGVHFTNAVIQMTNDGYIQITSVDNPDDTHFVELPINASTPIENGYYVARWTSDEFTWYGETAPEFDVEENLLGEEIASSVEPSHGFLSDTIEGTDLVKVTAINKDTTSEPVAGYLHIIKTLENADKVSDEYVKSLVFKFKISVDTYEPYIVSLQPERIDNTYVWEYKSDKFEWQEDEEALHYTIEEIEVPEGTAFVSGNGGTSTTVSGQLQRSESQDHVIYTDNEFINKCVPKSGDLTIEKKALDDSIANVPFTFHVTLKGDFEYNGVEYKEGDDCTFDVVVNAGSSVTTSTISWYGDSEVQYVVTEEESDVAEIVSLINGAGIIQEGTHTTLVTATNQSKKTGGYLQITKKIDGSITSDDVFTFRVSIDGYEPFNVDVKANQTVKTDYIEWNINDPAPGYSVEEINIPEGAELVRIDNSTGTLVSKDTVSVVAYNKYEEHSGNFEVIKQIIADEKLLPPDYDPTFDIQMTISGTFEMNGESVVESTRVLTTTLRPKEKYTSPTIKWYGNNAPSVTVVETNMPLGWKNVGISNNGSTLTENETITIKVTNKLETLSEISLTMKLAGNTWVDVPQDTTGKNTPESVVNGLLDDNEQRVKGVEVYIYDGDGALATIYDDGAEISQPILTDDNGHWEAPDIKVSVLGGYDVEFVYDGQTYEPTKFLATSDGDANAYKNATTAARDRWERDSKALDYDRVDVDNRIQKVYGKSDIDGAGRTVGYVDGNRGQQTVTYQATNFGQQDSITNSTRLVSKLNTLNADGTAMDLFKAKARTSVGGLTYPFDKQHHLANIDTHFNELGLVQEYIYSATYNYMLNINLGLKERAKADVGASKDLYSAKVVVNDRLVTYRFNKLDDYGQDLLTRQLTADTAEIKYELGLYSSDYYYRAEVYKTNSEIYDAVEEFYKNLGTSLDATELDIYLTYKIDLYNESYDYLVQFNEIADYFDSTFGAPIDTKVEKYVKTIDGKDQEGLTEVANVSTISVNGGAAQTITWNVTNKDLKGSDDKTYNRMVTELSNVKLATGEKARIYVTFRLDKDTAAGVQDAIKLGDKSNVVEVSNYTTYYTDGSIAGKIDGDSAPDNVNIFSLNERGWYEDDTDQAPVFKLELLDETREISGTAFEDNENNESTVGVLDDNEALIGGLTTELVEKVKVKSDSGYKEYDFVWPTNLALDSLGGNTIENLTGFDSTTETSRENVAEGLQVGQYEFTSVPTGNYAVRFLYGNEKLDLDDAYANTPDAVALKADGTIYSGNENILTANYDGDQEGKTQAVYNGQDYKSTVYQAGYTSVDGDGFVNNEWHDIANEALNSARVSDARDSETQRLAIMAKSETITNANGSVLATANTKSTTHTDLYRDYNMYSDTAKLNLNILGDRSLGNEVEGKVTIMGQSVGIDQNSTTFKVANIDCGLIERPETKVVLDKEIQQIKITTNDGKAIFDASYDISYSEVSDLLGSVNNRVIIAKLDNGKYLVADVRLNQYSVATEVMQALDKIENKLIEEGATNGGTQNFRYINVDNEILQGTTIEINYLFTALNVGEKDMTSATLDEIAQVAKNNKTTPKAEILKLAQEVNTSERESATEDSVVKIGQVLGTTYYTGDERVDRVVTTKVRQVVDYVDNDAVYTATYNTDPNHSWRTTTMTELTGSGYRADNLIDRSVISEYEIIDKDGRNYLSSDKSNIVLSVDDDSDSASFVNKEFEAALVPYEVDPLNSQSNIVLTITKVVSAEDDTDKLSFDNIAEIVKTENTVGRRDVVVLHGNANPKLGEFAVSLAERDSSATELVTFAPPTGIDAGIPLRIQVLVVVLAGLIVVAAGVVVIKKTVLK